MYKPYKGRTLKRGVVEIYRCLNRRGKTFSIRQEGKVVGHTETLYLRDCEFVVREGEKKRARKTGGRNVHAFIRGKMTINPMGIETEPISYDPFSENNFINDSGHERTTCKSAIIHNGRIWASKD